MEAPITGTASVLVDGGQPSTMTLNSGACMRGGESPRMHAPPGLLWG